MKIFQKKIANKVRDKLKNTLKSNIILEEEKENSSKKIDNIKYVEPIEIENPPTLLEIINVKNEAYKGKRLAVKFKTNADPKYFENTEKFKIEIDNENMCNYDGKTSVTNGYGTIYYTIKEDSKIGDKFTVKIILIIDDNYKLESSKEFIVKEWIDNTIKTKSKQQKTKYLQDINIVIVKKGDEFWEKNDWNEKKSIKSNKN
ncbi:hypothetical protein [Thermobrachium celere]|uniref:hypothetical protein n=1 Tax=Thermobrachium celere TaxID=53422 RepID=UPI0019440231|nr:hypothetical protein [Thermobrachium celere]GFR35445.1 hypothetical protein TCEA9_12570 [Thermobrachium celere]